MWEMEFTVSEEMFMILIFKAVITSYASELFSQAPPGSHTHLSTFSKNMFSFFSQVKLTFIKKDRDSGKHWIFFKISFLVSYLVSLTSLWAFSMKLDFTMTYKIKEKRSMN